MLVRNRMSHDVVTVEPQESVGAARALLRRHRIHHLPVVRNRRLIGIVTDRDLRSAGAHAKTVAELMTSKPVIIDPDAFVDEAARLMRTHVIGALPVVDGRTLVGILTASDILDAFIDVSGVAESSYQIVLSGAKGKAAERQVREAVHHRHGELKWLKRDAADPSRLLLRLRAKNIDDITTDLEAAGFEVDAVVASARRAA